MDFGRRDDWPMEDSARRAGLVSMAGSYWDDAITKYRNKVKPSLLKCVVFERSRLLWWNNGARSWTHSWRTQFDVNGDTPTYRSHIGLLGRLTWRFAWRTWTGWSSTALGCSSHQSCRARSRWRYRNFRSRFEFAPSRCRISLIFNFR